MTHSLVAGAVASLAAVSAFFVVHHIWIKPIWIVAPAGIPIAILGGLALGWAHFHLRAALPPGVWAAPAVLALILGILGPAIMLSLTHGPLFDIATAKVPEGEGARVAVRFCLELLLTATLAGALIGWRLGGTPVAALATALAGLALAVGPGHNIPMFGTHPLALKGMAIVLILSVVTAVSLPATLAVLER